MGIFCDGSAGVTGSGQCPSDATSVNAFPVNTLVSLYDPCLNTGNGNSANQCAVTPVPLGSTHWIHNDDTAALFFNNPFAGVSRNTLRAQTINNLDFGVFKNTKLREGLNMQLQFNALNVLNRQFRGTPDPFVDDGNFANRATFGGGSFMNTFFNNSDGQLTTGHRRRMTFGVKFTF